MAGLERPLQPMQENIRAALKKRGLTEAYEARPDYQRNDYLGWIAQAKREETKAKRSPRCWRMTRKVEDFSEKVMRVSKTYSVLSAPNWARGAVDELERGGVYMNMAWRG